MQSLASFVLNFHFESYLVFLVRKKQLLLLKKELKCWESMFERKHGRKPTKVSIARHKYGEYWYTA